MLHLHIHLHINNVAVEEHHVQSLVVNIVGDKKRGILVNKFMSHGVHGWHFIDIYCVSALWVQPVGTSNSSCAYVAAVHTIIHCAISWGHCLKKVFSRVTRKTTNLQHPRHAHPTDNCIQEECFIILHQQSQLVGTR